MASQDYLIAIALIEQNNVRAMPLGGKEIKEKLEEEGNLIKLGEEVILNLLLRVFQRSDEGALKRVSANSKFTNQPIDLALVKDALKDLFVISAKMVSIENIQKTVSEYYNIKLSDLLSKRRSRSITRPRQLAMALTKELTNHSLPEIGEAFNGRDHTTVMHAIKTVEQKKVEKTKVYQNISQITNELNTNLF